MSHIEIAQRRIGGNEPPFVIAEAGINHNGDLERAYQMIRQAKLAGVDAIKFQTFRAEDFIGDPSLTFTYTSQGKQVTEPMLQMFKRYEFSREQWFLIKERCDREQILFLSTPQNPADLDLLLEIGIPAIKVGSDDFVNTPLLKNYSRAGLPMIISCGMADLAEVYQGLEAVGSLDGHPTVLMLCTSEYPAPPENVNLLKLRTLADAFPAVVLGFSDHTQGPLASSLAVALGAKVFEKHFTLDHGLPGPDHWFSEDPPGLQAWVASIRTATTLLGDSRVRPTVREQEMRKLARRSIITTADVRKGDLFSGINLGLKRPGSGLPAQLYDKVLGLRATKEIPANTLLKWGDFE